MVTFSIITDQGFKAFIPVNYIVSVVIGLVDIASEDGGSIEKHALYISTVNGDHIGVYETKRSCGKEFYRVMRSIRREIDYSGQAELDEHIEDEIKIDQYQELSGRF